MAKEFCRDRVFPTKLIGHLPREYSFADGSKSLVVDYATTDQLGQCRKMIEEAALRGDNVGVDEYDCSAIETMFGQSEIFRACDPVSGGIEAFMFIQPCLYQRTYDACTASVHVFHTKDLGDEVYAELMSLAADFAIDIDIGYTQCFTQVALCLHGLYLQLRRKGFIAVAVLPNWVNIAGASLVDNAIMVKDFGLPDRPLRSSAEVLKMIEPDKTPDRLLKEYTSVDSPQIPDLPKVFLLENGTKLVLRNARKDDDQILYAMFSDAVEKGEGYSVHEFPSLNTMRLEVLAKAYTAVIEEEKTNKLIGCLIFQDAAMSRSGKGKVCDESILVSAELRGKGFGRVLETMAHFVTTTLGYESVLREAFVTNNRSLKLRKHGGLSVCGILPRCGFQMGVGWIDLSLSVKEVDKKHSNHLPENTKCRL